MYDYSKCFPALPLIFGFIWIVYYQKYFVSIVQIKKGRKFRFKTFVLFSILFSVL